MSFLTGIYPDALKICKTITIHKGGLTTKLNNYRPITLLSIFDKIIEKIMHHHSFNVSVPLKMGHTAPMFVLSFFLHSILFVGSALDSFQCLRSLLIVSFHVFFSLPRPRCPSTSNSVMLLIQPSFLTTCPHQRSRLYRNKVCMLLRPSFLRRESELMWSFKRTLHVHRIIARSFCCSLSRSLTLGANNHWHTTRQCGYTCCIFAHV